MTSMKSPPAELVSAASGVSTSPTPTTETMPALGVGAVPSFDEYRDAMWVHTSDAWSNASEAETAFQVVTEFETAVRRHLAARFAEASVVGNVIVMPAWSEMHAWLRGALFDAALVGARVGEGGAL